MKKILFAASVLLVTLSSCTTIKKTATTIDVNNRIESASDVDLEISSRRISYTYEDTADGIECISTPEEDAPAQYFNLQGQRIYYPEPGQLVIKRQGSQTVKTIIR